MWYQIKSKQMWNDCILITLWINGWASPKWYDGPDAEEFSSGTVSNLRSV